MIKTIALDYGRVLAIPRSGDWFFPRHTWRILGPTDYLRFLFAGHKKKAARNKAGKFLNDNHLILTEQEEFDQFYKFYLTILGACGIKNLEQSCQTLAQFTVYDPRKVKFFRDVAPGIASLKKQHRVVIISDTWPSLRSVLQCYGVAVDDLILSNNYGHQKGDDGKLFHSAIEHHGIVPKETLFVDDSVRNLDYAKALGFHTAQMLRYPWAKRSGHHVVRNMRQLKKLAGEII